MEWCLLARIWWAVIWRTLAISILLLVILFFANKFVGGSAIVEHASRILPMVAGIAVQIWALRNAMLRHRARIEAWFSSIDQKE